MLQLAYIEYVQSVVNLFVGTSGYPVEEGVLLTQGIVSKKKLKTLVRAGHLVRRSVHIEGIKYHTYYTNEFPPKNM